MTQPATSTPRSTLPRRANTIRAVAATMAHKRLTLVTARQLVSDRIGYIVAAITGACAYRYFGRTGVELLAGLYVISVILAYRRWKRLDGE